MSDLQKVITNSVIGALSLVAVVLLWEYPYLLLIALMSIGIIMNLVLPNKRSLVVYAVSAVFGPIAEIIAINGGVWEYTNPQILGVPVWLPFLWGNAALFMLNTERLAHFVYKKR